MRTLPAVVVVSLVAITLSACSDSNVSPTAPLSVAPPVAHSYVGSEPATNDLCNGLSPCDAYPNYFHGLVGVSGFCFLPPTVDNHLSDPACSGAFVPGLNGVFKLAWCKVSDAPEYLAKNGEEPPTLGDCQKRSEWQDLVQDPNGGEFYAASVQWKKKDANVGDVFRLYVVQEVAPQDLRFAHRDVIIDPNLTTPADAFVHAIGYGTEPVKVRITQGFDCVRYDTQASGTDNAATCLVDGDKTFEFASSPDATYKYDVSFHFPDGNPTFLANFEVSECLPLGFYINDATGDTTGNALVDTPLADCKVSLSSQQVAELTVPGQINVTVEDPRWDTGGPFEKARINVLQADEAGVAALPPSSTPSPDWFGTATSDNIVLRWIGKGLDKLASIILPRAAYAGITSAGFDFTRMSDFQVSNMVNLDFDQDGGDCSISSPSCLDLGSFPGNAPVAVHVKASAPDNTGPHTYPEGYFAAPDTRLHFFPGTGTVSCLGGPSVGPVHDADGGVCYPANTPDSSTTPASYWDHLVYVTGSQGKASVDWALASGGNTLRVSGCGVARPGDHEPSPPAEPGSDGVWGTLSSASCSDRQAAMTDATAYDNGPADGFTPFEPVDIQNEVAIYGLPLTFHAHTCPQIKIDGVEDGAEWSTCADSVGFSAPLKGPKGDINAWFYTYNDADAVYVALKVKTTDLGNKAFLNFVENTTDTQANGDELLLLDFSDPTVSHDWHFTQSCVDNNASSLCGDPDSQLEDTAYAVQAAAQVDGAGSGYVFYEFKRPLTHTHSTWPGKEDLAAAKGGTIGVRVTVTQGQGGGKGGFVYPDPHTSPVLFHLFTIK